MGRVRSILTGLPLSLPCFSAVAAQVGVLGGVRGADARMAEGDFLHPWRVPGGEIPIIRAFIYSSRDCGVVAAGSSVELSTFSGIFVPSGNCLAWLKDLFYLNLYSNVVPVHFFYIPQSGARYKW